MLTVVKLKLDLFLQAVNHCLFEGREGGKLVDLVENMPGRRRDSTTGRDAGTATRQRRRVSSDAVLSDSRPVSNYHGTCQAVFR